MTVLQVFTVLALLFLFFLLFFASDFTPERKIEGVDVVKVVNFEKGKPASFQISISQCIGFVQNSRAYYDYDLEVVYFDTQRHETVQLIPSHTDNYRLYLSEASFRNCENQHEVWELFLKAYNELLDQKEKIKNEKE